MLAGGFLILFTDPLSDRIMWLAENYRVGALPLSESGIKAVEDGLNIWAWSGIIVGVISLLLAHHDIRSAVARTIFFG